MAWAQDFLPSKVITLTGQNFAAMVLQSKEAWVVDFYANWCGPCQQFASEYELVAEVGSKTLFLYVLVLVFLTTFEHSAFKMLVI